MSRRVSVELPEETIALLDRAAPKGDRGKVIDQALLLREAFRRYLQEQPSTEDLHAQIKEGALANADRDQRTAEEWFPLDEEAWQVSQRQRR